MKTSSDLNSKYLKVKTLPVYSLLQKLRLGLRTIKVLDKLAEIEIFWFNYLSYIRNNKTLPHQFGSGKSL